MKTYIIAGGSSGIGLEIVKLLSAEGNNVIVLSRNPGGTSKLGGVRHFPIDFAADAPVLPDITGPIDGIAYCPGTINLKPLKMLKPDDFINDFRINLLGAVNMINKYHANLKQAGNSSLLLFSTVAVQTGMPYHASVASAKGAVEGLTRSLAAEFAPAVRVNCIAPSITSTPLAEKLLNSEAKMKASEERHPLKRIGNAAEIARLSLFLLTQSSAFITGQVIKYDGGMSSVKII
ncbi:MAG: SDR family oxidoreductase [Ignavibacteriaceae bacterium]|nr:SDR family oxidoreductase [Ignavibacteriaceae bacterium]